MDIFITDDFLLQNNTAKTLYHDYAAKMPIYDYHNHLPAGEISEDKNFDNLTQIWLYGDHYKWRLMRANGVNEKYITGNATDYEKFQKWASTVPYCIGNPLYHWVHLELKKPFAIADRLLNPETARYIYDATTEMLHSPQFSVRNLLRKFNVKLLCTTEDPLDSLEHHQKIKNDNFEIKVHTAWRPDKAMAVEDEASFNNWVDGLAVATNTDIKTFDDFIEAIKLRHDYFHDNGCRLSDTGLTKIDFCAFTTAELKKIFLKIRGGHPLSPQEQTKFKSAVLIELSIMNFENRWAQQFHIGASRNNNSRMFGVLGADAGFDSIADYEVAEPLSAFLDALASQNKLAKTIIYNLNPSDNEVIAAMTGNFQDGETPGKIQFGAAWWFLDHKSGMEKQLQTLSNLGLLSRFIGMLTDSRSFLSFSRHEYFRRILCNMLAEKVEAGLLPNDMKLLGEITGNICFNNAENYFTMEL